MKRVRLDTELVRRGLVASRTEAQRAIADGLVKLKGVVADKAATLITTADPIVLDAAPSPFVSRGGVKLDGALRDLGIEVTGKRWLDAGASTGGFTDRLLQGGAEGVVALDVGYGQLDWRLRNDERVIVMERTNVRSLTPQDLPWIPDGVVADLSFISLAVVLEALTHVVAEDGDLVLLVKPQFEVGRGDLGKGGVVRDPALWHASLLKVTETARPLGYGLVAASLSDLVGPAGNREFFIHLKRGHDSDMGAIERVVRSVTL